ncbi:hypothetical protein LDENG_00260830 [Lucifuga dentata]|nr:hypothetical protein LDENG_00260830 [Lucifuga dentata]
MRHTGLVLPVGSMNRNESVHSGLNALFSLSTFLFLESAICSLFLSPFLRLTCHFLNFLRRSRLYLSLSPAQSSVSLPLFSLHVSLSFFLSNVFSCVACF